MPRYVCIHQLDDIQDQILGDFPVIGRTQTRNELREMVGSASPAIVLLDLDKPDALNAITLVLELHSEMAVVGVTGAQDINTVIEAQRAGCRQVVTRPVDSNDLVVALRRAIHERQDTTRRKMCAAVIGATGGAGSTTISSYLGVELADMSGANGLIMDLDFEFVGVAHAFDLTPRYTIADLAEAGGVDPVLIEKAVASVDTDTHVLGRPPTIQAAHAIDFNAVREIVRACRQLYGNVVLDLPRKLDPITGVGIEAADCVLIVLQLTIPAVENTRRLVDTLTEEGVAAEKIQFVVNRYRRGVHGCTVDMVEEQLHRPILATIPSDYQAVRTALDSGQKLAGRNSVRAAIRGLARQLLALDQPSDEHTGKRKGWLSSLGLKRG